MDNKIQDLPPAKSQRHELSLKICTHDFRGEYAGRKALETVFEIIEKVKCAVHAKGGKVMSFKFDNTPTREDNPSGDIATLSFDIRTPYQCTAELEFLYYHWVTMRTIGPETDTTAAIDFKVRL